MKPFAQWRPPQGPGFELVGAGYAWDAVHMPRSMGEAVIGKLGENCGAVIQDGYAHTLYWLITPRTADSWEPVPGSSVTILGVTSYVAVPPLGRTEGPGLWWKVPPEPLRYLTDADQLEAALVEERRWGRGRCWRASRASTPRSSTRATTGAWASAAWSCTASG